MKLFVRGYRGQGYGSGAIKWFTRSQYSHVSLVFFMHGVWEEIEAIQGKGVISHKPHSARRKDFAEYSVPASEEQIISIHIGSRSVLGAKYDWQGVFSFLLHRTKHTLNKFFCSEFVAYQLLKGGYKLSRRVPYKQSPDLVMESLMLVEPVTEIGGA
jgi:hypothetical protein